MKKFTGQMVYFLTFTRDDSKVLFWTSSDRVPGNYYLLDRANGNKIVQIGARMPWFEGKQVAQMKPIEFKTRDGAKLYGYYTAPVGAAPGPKPLVVMPHGGPFGPSDTWGLDDDVQFLASRGYGVLQVNYRGSGGRGDKFTNQAFKQWGGMIQNDITDGVKYAIDQKLADPDRICMYGASVRWLLGDDAADPQPRHVQVRDRLRRRVRPAAAQQEQGIGVRRDRTLVRTFARHRHGGACRRSRRPSARRKSRCR